MLSIREFLTTVVTCPTDGWFCLSYSNGTGKWINTWYRWPDQLDEIVKAATARANEANVYFSSYLFKATDAVKANVLPSRTIQADLDDADVAHLVRPPNILVESSPGRHQGYWFLDDLLELAEHEEISKKLTYSIPLCDRSGWPLGRKLRIPGTVNHKYLSGPKEVKVVAVTPRRYPPEEFEALPAVPTFVTDHFDDDFIESAPGITISEHPLNLLEKIKTNIPVSVYIQYSTRQADRSAALYALECAAFKAGLTRDEVFVLAKHSANNKFDDLQHRADEELAKDVLRAQHAVNSGDLDERARIRELYRKPLTSYDRKTTIFGVVQEAMRKQGEFMTTEGGQAFYVRRDIGRPIVVSPISVDLSTLLDVQFGINASDPESKYVREGMYAYASSIASRHREASLSYYNEQDNYLLLHTGRKEVLKITADTVEACTDGAYNVIFPWYSSVTPFTPSYRHSEVEWGDELFGNGSRGFGSSTENLVNMDEHHARAVLKVWFLFLLLRQAAESRPILAALGQPGSGKSTLFKKVLHVLYGPRKSVMGVLSAESFDYATAADPLVVLDNVDTWEKWLPDRLALAAGRSEIVRRKLWTDTGTVTILRQALLGVTAHNPKFGREDVADRFLLLSYRRIKDDEFVSEAKIYTDLLEKRSAIWGSIIRDLQRVLATPRPVLGRDRIPKFRVEDFASLGTWIARAIGEEDAFYNAINSVRTAQQSFNLEEEGFLVTALRKYTETSRTSGDYVPVSQLWGMLELTSGDAQGFRNAYRTATVLSKKLSSMQSSLKRVFNIDTRIDTLGLREWRIAKLTNGEDNGSDTDSDSN